MPSGEQDTKFLKTMARRLAQLHQLVLTGRFDLRRQELRAMTAGVKAKLERVARLVDEKGMDGGIVRKTYPALDDNDMPPKQRERLLVDASEIALGAYTARKMD